MLVRSLKGTVSSHPCCCALNQNSSGGVLEEKVLNFGFCRCCFLQIVQSLLVKVREALPALPVGW